MLRRMDFYILSNLFFSYKNCNVIVKIRVGIIVAVDNINCLSECLVFNVYIATVKLRVFFAHIFFFTYFNVKKNIFAF